MSCQTEGLFWRIIQEIKFDYTKGVTRSRNLKKDRQRDGQKEKKNKKTKNDEKQIPLRRLTIIQYKPS